MAGVTAALLGEWFDRHAATLVLYARQWVGQAVAEDIVQDVFVRLAVARERPAHANIRAFLFAAVRHGALDAIRGARRRKARDQRTRERVSPLFVARADDTLDAGDVERSVVGLGPQQREIVTLRIWAGATFQEIADLTGLPVSTVHVRYAEALDALRTFWEIPCKNH